MKRVHQWDDGYPLCRSVMPFGDTVTRQEHHVSCPKCLSIRHERDHAECCDQMNYPPGASS